MDLEYVYGSIYFDSFESVVSWLCSDVPYFLIAVFIMNCVFAILDTIIHIGGKK